MSATDAGGQLKQKEGLELVAGKGAQECLSFGPASTLPDDVIAAYDAPFPTAESKAGAAAFPLLVPTSPDAAGAAQMGAVVDELSRWTKPTLVAFSDSDPVFPFPQSGQFFCELLPTAAEQVQVRAAGHFLQEDRGALLPSEVLKILT